MWSLAVFALCLCSTSANTPPSTSIVITYDDIVSNPVANELDPIPSPYKQLVFKQFDARANGASIIRSVSGNNTATSNELNNLLAGQTPNITSDYTGSPVAFFDLKCTIQFKGITTSGKTVSALCNYDAKQRQVEYCDFKGQLNNVRYVTVVPTDTDTLDATTVELLDNTEVVRHYY